MLTEATAIEAKAPPQVITLVYRKLGMTHVFIAEEFRGFHVGGSSLRDAWDTAVHALGKHVAAMYGLRNPIQYQFEGTLDEFEDRLQDANAPLNFSVTARMAE